jgi:ZIP family zinc transporter
MLAIGLHNLPEGMATFMAGYEDMKLGVAIAVAIAMHNIPEGISVALPVYFSTGSRKKAVLYALLSGLAEPVGALIVFFALRSLVNPFLLAALFASITGIMIYISVEELIPSSRQYSHERLALLSTFAGICVMPLTHLI